VVTAQARKLARRTAQNVCERIICYYRYRLSV
jgi:hypothetical protein